MNHLSGICAASIVLAVGVTYAIAAPPSPAFSADYSASGPGLHGSLITVAGMVWVAHDKIRRETLDEGHLMVFLIDPAAHTVTQLVPDQGFYADTSNLPGLESMPGGPSDFLPYDPTNPCANRADVVCTSKGVQTIRGRACVSWRLKHSTGSTVDGCIDRKLGFMVEKSEGDRHFEMSNIREGIQDARLFEIPSDLKKVSLDPTRVPALLDGDYKASK
jgi:hypothetical protein